MGIFRNTGPVPAALRPAMQKTGYQLTADNPSFAVTFRLPAAQSESSSILPYWVSALRHAFLFILFIASVVYKTMDILTKSSEALLEPT